MIVLTEEEIISIFDSGREFGSEEAIWRHHTVPKRKALMEALAQILYDRQVAESKEAWPLGGQWPEDSEIVEAFGLKNV